MPIHLTTEVTSVLGKFIKLLPNDIFKFNFGINANKIEIHVVDESNFLKGSDYFPSKPVKNYYTASYAPELEISYDFYKFEDTSKYALYSFDQELEYYSFDVSNGTVTHRPLLSSSSSNISRGNILLPKIVLLGSEWESNPFSTAITDLDVLISTPAGDFNCIEVTYYYETQEVSKNYYSKGIGLIKYVDDYEYLELNKIGKSDVE